MDINEARMLDLRRYGGTISIDGGDIIIRIPLNEEVAKRVYERLKQTKMR
jgi:hypothetical protein